MLSIIVPVRNESDNLKSLFDYFSKNIKSGHQFDHVITRDRLIDRSSFLHEFIAEI